VIAGATEFTQIANNLQLLMSYVEQAQQTVTQVRQYQAMLMNLRQMTPSSLLDASAQKLWQDQGMSQAFRDLRTIYVNGQKAAYSLSTLDAQFKAAHPGRAGMGKGFDFNKAYAMWSNGTKDAVNGALKVMAAHADDFDNEQSLMRELSAKSASAQGQLEVTQVGNQVGMAMVTQLQKLGQLQAAQIQQEGNAIAGAQSRTDAGDAKLQEYLANGKSFRVDPKFKQGKAIFQ
jgi:P-type conjugative transfer protein TrbJ